VAEASDFSRSEKALGWFGSTGVQAPGLPPRSYQAVLFQVRHLVPALPAITIRVTRR